MSDMIQLTSSDGFAFDALHAAPEGRRRGGVVVIQEVFGLDRYVHEDVARWAALGFEVTAPSMFDRQKRGFVVPHEPDAMAEGAGYMTANGWDNPVKDVQACIDAMKARGPVFAVGYCYGGLVAWIAASACTDLAAASAYYGMFTQAVEASKRCPVICHLGGEDTHIPPEATRDAILAKHPDVPVFIYPRSGHGFNNDGGPGQTDREEAARARRRTLELFEAHGAV